MSMFAKEFEPDPAVWGVGRIEDAGVTVPWAVSRGDVEDESQSMARFLTELGLTEDGIVLVVALLSQAVHAVPLEQAAGHLGARYSSADATEADAFRVAYLMRQLAPQVVVGVTAPVLDGLERAGHDLAVLFGDLRAVCPRGEDAAARLRAAGLAPRPWWMLGPTSGFELRPGEVSFDAERWDVSPDGDGAAVVRNRVARLTPCDGVRASVGAGRTLVPFSAS